MKIPPVLKSGDTIGVTATSRKVSPTQVATAINTFTNWGLNTKTGVFLFGDSHSYLAGTDEQRLESLQALLDDDQCRAIICARGGYGSSRIIDKIDLTALKQNPKWIVGFSDVTALHLKLYKAGIGSIHGTMPILFDKPGADESIASLKKLLFDGESIIRSISINPQNRLGVGSGPLIGGNLSLIVDSLGTSSEVDTAGAILVLEEIDEYLYRIDRMMNQLKRAGKLDHLKGLVIGYVTDTKDTEVFDDSIETIVNNLVGHLSYPIAFNFPIGHEHPNIAFLHGGEYRLDVNGEGATLKLVT